MKRTEGWLVAKGSALQRFLMFILKLKLMNNNHLFEVNYVFKYLK